VIGRESSTRGAAFSPTDDAASFSPRRTAPHGIALGSCFLPLASHRRHVCSRRTARCSTSRRACALRSVADGCQHAPEHTARPPAASLAALQVDGARAVPRAVPQKPHLVSVCPCIVCPPVAVDRAGAHHRSIVALAGWCAYYIPWYYRNVIQKPYHNFPEPVAKKLRRAIFYSRGPHLDVREANKHFRQALQLATEMGMDPFSDEIMGVKYAIAALFEEQGYHAMACDVLEIMRSDTQRWIDEFSDKHIADGDRSRVKKNMVQINLKLGQLYGCPYVNEPKDAEKRLVEAVERALGEQQRRETEGVEQGEGAWMTSDELGATLEGTSALLEATLTVSRGATAC
jgi:hypothetical protein